ncbi:DUF1015 domain-containing protein [Bacillota bacterium]
MATVRPFAALRPAARYAERVISLPYDVMNRREAARLAENNPYSFLHICRSEIDLPDLSNPYDSDVYLRAKKNLDDSVSAGILIRDDNPSFYIYRQSMDGRIQTGIVGCVSVDEYMEGIIKKHEYTRVEKELDRINHFDICNANTEPVFLTYRNNEALGKLIDGWIKGHEPAYDFVSGDGIGHALWVVNDPAVIGSIGRLFKEIPYLYIADGHHRSASAAKVSMKRRQASPDYRGDEEFNFFMAVIFPDTDLHIFDYNRVVNDLKGLTAADFLESLSGLFEVENMGESSYSPEAKHVFSMYLEGNWYKLTAKASIITDHAIKGLDVSLLQDYVLGPILGINDPRTDSRIDFVGGIRGLEELKFRVDNGMAAAFALYPVSMDDLLKVADQNEVMPPKSTWFEPKLGSGLFVHTL